MTADHPRILLVGAYERDNFGDLLFLLQTEKYLPASADVVAAAPFAADMTSLLYRRVEAFGPLLESEEVDHIWTVGGEVGGANVRQAFRMVASQEELARWDGGDEATKTALLRERVGATPIDSPYMPRPAAYPRNVGASLTLNSVGFAGVPTMSATRQRMVLDISRSADRISVRDNRSSEWLTKHKIQHTVAPDLVHTIARTRPWSGTRDEQLALVQVSQPEIGRRGLHVFAEALARSKQLEPYTIRFFVAGTAPGHDSMDVYQRLADEIWKITPGRPIEFSDKRRPYDLVDEIASAGLWVGLSLHGRIISGAYGVPRVSFTKRKVDAYASTWDPGMPWGITPDQLDDAIAEALSPQVQAASAIGPDLAAQAERNILEAVEQLSLGDPNERIRRRLSSVEDWQRWLSKRIVAKQARIVADKAEIDRLERQLAAAEERADPVKVLARLSYSDTLKLLARRGVRGVASRAASLRRNR